MIYAYFLEVYWQSCLLWLPVQDIISIKSETLFVYMLKHKVYDDNHLNTIGYQLYITFNIICIYAKTQSMRWLSPEYDRMSTVYHFQHSLKLNILIKVIKIFILITLIKPNFTQLNILILSSDFNTI